MTHQPQIPRIIHYCWFGHGPLPDSAKKCIASWQRFFPDYVIKEWNESNFDVNICRYTSQAYAAKKYAFVSDYARFHILYNHGGLYFDTDVEVTADFSDILSAGPFMGYEADPDAVRMPYGTVNPGLGLGAYAGMDIYKKMLNHYNTLDFVDKDGIQVPGTVVFHATEVLKENGLKPLSVPQTVCGVTVYGSEYFNPLNDATGELCATGATHSIHWYAKTWTGLSPIRIRISRLSHRIFGLSFSARIKQLLHIR
ncbi:MAG: glycosyltransferase [Bacteroidales bacterium]|nr:glycosyltransferase [Bacteroidales bacterium]